MYRSKLILLGIRMKLKLSSAKLTQKVSHSNPIREILWLLILEEHVEGELRLVKEFCFACNSNFCLTWNLQMKRKQMRTVRTCSNTVNRIHDVFSVTVHFDPIHSRRRTFLVIPCDLFDWIWLQLVSSNFCLRKSITGTYSE